MPKEVIRFQCEHCKEKTYSTKGNCVRHENDCYANPNMKACRTCKHYSKVYETVYNPYHGGDPGSTDYEREYSWCIIKEKELGREIPFKHYCPSYSPSNRDNFKVNWRNE